MHWSVATWIIVILFFIVCHCKLSQGSRISKIVCQCLLLLVPASFILLQPLSLFTGFPQNDESSFKPCISYRYLTTEKPIYLAPYLPLYTSAVKTRHSNPEKMIHNMPYYSSSKVYSNRCSHMILQNLLFKNYLPLEGHLNCSYSFMIQKVT